METKICSRCKETKALSEFHKNWTAKDGLNSNCKQCRSLTNKRRYESHKEDIKEASRRYYLNNRSAVIERVKRNKSNKGESK